MTKPNIFFKLSKVNLAEQTVEGIATAELPDKTGEICDYETTVPYYKVWSDGIKKASGGKSLGNVRAMHGNVAAGKVIDIMFDDVAKAIRIVAKIVDAAEWAKVVEGVYTGFSQGGEYIKRWKDGEFMRYTAEPSEVSIVDNPCLGEAIFEVIKADGTIERQAMKKPAASTEPELEQVWKAKDGSVHKTKHAAMQKNIDLEADVDAAAIAAPANAALDGANDALEKRTFSDAKRKELADKGHAMPDGSFPIETTGDLENAVAAHGRAKDPEKAKEHIIARAKDLKATDKLPADWEGSTAEKDDADKGEAEKAKAAQMTKRIDLIAKLKKFGGCEAWDAAQALDALMSIQSLLSGEMWESEEGDDEGDQCQMLAEVVERLKAFIAAEIMEGTRDDGTLAMAAHGGLTKAEHEEHVTAIHKGASNIMTRCMKCMGKDMENFMKAVGDEMADHVAVIHKKAGDIANRCMKMGSKFKSEDEGDDAGDDEDTADVKKLAKAVARGNALEKHVGDLTGKLGDLLKRIDNLERQPAERKGAIFITDRSHEANPGEKPVEDASNLPSLHKARLSPEEQRAMQHQLLSSF